MKIHIYCPHERDCVDVSLSTDKITGILAEAGLMYFHTETMDSYAANPPGIPNISKAVQKLPWFKRSLRQKSTQLGQKHILIYNPLLAKDKHGNIRKDILYRPLLAIIILLYELGFPLYFLKKSESSFTITKLSSLTELSEMSGAFPPVDVLHSNFCQQFNLDMSEVFLLDVFTSIQLSVSFAEKKYVSVLPFELLEEVIINHEKLLQLADYFPEKININLDPLQTTTDWPDLVKTFTHIPPKRVSKINYGTLKVTNSTFEQFSPARSLAMDLDAVQNLDEVVQCLKAYSALEHLSLKIGKTAPKITKNFDFKKLRSISVSYPLDSYPAQGIIDSTSWNAFRGFPANASIDTLKLEHVPYSTQMFPFPINQVEKLFLSNHNEKFFTDNNYITLYEDATQLKNLTLKVLPQHSEPKPLALSCLSLKNKPLLESLSLIFITISAQELYTFLASTPNLRSLSLTYCVIASTEAESFSASGLIKQYRLNKLDISSETLKYAPLTILFNIIKNSPDLRILKLKGNICRLKEIGDALNYCQQLESLHIIGTSIISSTPVGDIIKAPLYRLKSFKHRYWPLSISLSHIPAFSPESGEKLEDGWESWNELEKAMFQKLQHAILSHAPNLEKIDITDFDESSNTMEVLSFSKVKLLHLSHSKLSFNWLRESLKKNTCLEELMLRNTALTDAAKPSEIKIFSLTHLTITNSKLTAHDLKNILETFPNLTYLSLEATEVIDAISFDSNFTKLVKFDFSSARYNIITFNNLIEKFPNLYVLSVAEAGLCDNFAVGKESRNITLFPACIQTLSPEAQTIISRAFVDVIHYPRLNEDSDAEEDSDSDAESSNSDSDDEKEVVDDDYFSSDEENSEQDFDTDHFYRPQTAFIDARTFTSKDTTIEIYEHFKGVPPKDYRIFHVLSVEDDIVTHYIPQAKDLIPPPQYKLSELKEIKDGEAKIKANGNFYQLPSLLPYDVAQNIRVYPNLKHEVQVCKHTGRYSISITPDNVSDYAIVTYTLYYPLALLTDKYKENYQKFRWPKTSKEEFKWTEEVIRWVCHTFPKPEWEKDAIQWLYGKKKNLADRTASLEEHGGHIHFMAQHYSTLLKHYETDINPFFVTEFQNFVRQYVERSLDRAQPKYIEALIAWLFKPSSTNTPMILLAARWHTLDKHKRLALLIKYYKFPADTRNKELEFSSTDDRVTKAITKQRSGACRHSVQAFLAHATSLISEFVCWATSSRGHIYIEACNANDITSYVTHPFPIPKVIRIDLGGVPAVLKPMPIALPALSKKRTELSPEAKKLAKWNFIKISYPSAEKLAKDILLHRSRSSLIEINNVQEVEILYQGFLHLTQEDNCQPRAYLFLGLQDIEKFSVCIKEGRKLEYPSAWAWLIKQNQPVAFIVDATNPNIHSHISTLHFLLDDYNRRLGRERLTDLVKVILLILPEQRCNFSNAFFSRIDICYTLTSSLNASAIIQNSPAPLNKKGVKSKQLYENTSAIDKLIGALTLTPSGNIDFTAGSLHKRNIAHTKNPESSYDLSLQNIPTNRLKDRLPYVTLFGARRYFTNGEWQKVSSNIHLYQEKITYDFPGVYYIYRFNSVPPAINYGAIISENTLDNFTENYKVDDNKLVPHITWLQQYANQKLDILVTVALTEAEWSRLLNKAKKHQIELHFHVSAEVTLPAGLFPINAITVHQTEENADNRAISHIQHADPQLVVAVLQQQYNNSSVYLAPSDYGSEQFLLKFDQNHKANDDAIYITAQYRCLYQDLMDGKTVILEGELSPELVEVLTGLLSSPAKLWLNGDWHFVRNSARLIWVHKNAHAMEKLFPARNFDPAIDAWKVLYHINRFSLETLGILHRYFHYLATTHPAMETPTYRFLLTILTLSSKENFLSIRYLLPYLFPSFSLAEIKALIKEMKQVLQPNVDTTSLALGKRSAEAAEMQQLTFLQPVAKQRKLLYPTNIDVLSQKRLHKLEQIWQSLPGAMLLGEPGAGKSYLALNLLRPYFAEKGITINLFISEYAFNQWLTAPATADSYNVWFVDEANLTPTGHWKYLEALLQGKPFFLNGKPYYLTAGHKFMFGGNSCIEKDRNPLPEVEPYMGSVLFKRQMLEEIKDNSLYPLADKLFAYEPNNPQNISWFIGPKTFVDFILDFYQKAGVELSSRQLINLTLKTWLLCQMRITPVTSSIHDLLYKVLNSLLMPNAPADAEAISSNIASFFTRPPNMVPHAGYETLNPTKVNRYLLTPSRQPMKNAVLEMLALRSYRQAIPRIQQVGNRAVIFEGPAGIGKTEGIIAIVEHEGYHLGNINNNALLHNHYYCHVIPKNDDPKEIIDILAKAAKRGWIVVIDELNTLEKDARAQVEAFLNTLLCGTDLYGIPFATEGFTVFITQNPAHQYKSCYHLSKPLLDRAEVIQVKDYPAEELYMVIKCKYPTLPAATIGQWVAAKFEAIEFAEQNHLHPKPCDRDLFKELNKIPSIHRR